MAGGAGARLTPAYLHFITRSTLDHPFYERWKRAIVSTQEVGAAAADHFGNCASTHLTPSMHRPKAWGCMRYCRRFW